MPLRPQAASTVREFFTLGGTSGDLRHDLAKEFITLSPAAQPGSTQPSTARIGRTTPPVKGAGAGGGSDVGGGAGRARADISRQQARLLSDHAKPGCKDATQSRVGKVNHVSCTRSGKATLAGGGAAGYGNSAKVETEGRHGRGITGRPQPPAVSPGKRKRQDPVPTMRVDRGDAASSSKRPKATHPLPRDESEAVGCPSPASHVISVIQRTARTDQCKWFEQLAEVFGRGSLSFGARSGDNGLSKGATYLLAYASGKSQGYQTSRHAPVVCRVPWARWDGKRYAILMTEREAAQVSQEIDAAVRRGRERSRGEL